MNKRYLAAIIVLALSGLVSCSSDDKKSSNEPQCVDEGKRCNQGTPQKCIDGTWVDQDACGDDQKCSKGDCIEKPPSTTTTTPTPNTCEGDDVRCSYSGVPQKCIEGEWADQTECQNEERCVEGRCVICTEGAKQCSPAGLPQVCTDGHWVDKAACDGDKQCSGGDCIEVKVANCLDNTTRCSTSGVPQKCVDGDWVNQTACDSDKECKGNGNCVLKDQPECGGKAKQCSDIGIPQVCDNGHWKNGTACDSQHKCYQGDCIEKDIPECSGTERQCSSSGVPQYCDNGKWKNDSACREGWACYNDVGTCLPSYVAECSAERKCIDDEFASVCVDYIWSFPPLECEEGTKCIDGYCVPEETNECESGRRKCINRGSSVICDNGKWVKSNCGESEVCINNECVDVWNYKECQESETACDGARHKYCLSGIWHTHLCEANQRCLNGKCEDYSVPDCTNGQKRCTESGFPEICKNNRWELADTFCNGNLERCYEGNCIPSCDASKCKLQGGKDYVGDNCVKNDLSAYVCGCQEDTDCKDKYKCDKQIKTCVPENTVNTDFSLYIPSTGSCDKFNQVNDLLDCQQNGKKFNLLFANNAEAEISASNISGGMANLKKPSTDYYIKLSHVLPTGQLGLGGGEMSKTVEFVWQHGSQSSAWANSKMKVSGFNDKTQLYTAIAQNEDMTSTFIPGYNLSTDEDVIMFEGTGTNVVKLKSVIIRDRVPGDEIIRTEESCKNASYYAYYGNKCLNTACSLCGCQEDTDCNEHYKCDKVNKRCIDQRSVACDAATENYMGSFYSPEHDRCGCFMSWDQEKNEWRDLDELCKDGYHCSNTECFNDKPKVFTLDFTQTPDSCEKLMSIPSTKRCSTYNVSDEEFNTLLLENSINIDMFKKSMSYVRQIRKENLEDYGFVDIVRPGYCLDYLGRNLMIGNLKPTDVIEIKWYVDYDPIYSTEGRLCDELYVKKNDDVVHKFNCEGVGKTMTSTFEVGESTYGNIYVFIEAPLSGLSDLYTYIDSITITRQ